MSDSSPLPPVRLRTEAELARDALAVPVLSRAVRLARWAGPDTRVGADGELLDEQLPAAATELGLDADADGLSDAGEAWRVAVGVGLVDVAEDAGGARAGAELALLTSGSPQDVLRLWLGALDTVVAEAAVTGPDGLEDSGAPGAGAAERAAEAEFLDGVLGNLYLLSVGGEEPDDGPVPLPALAASMIVPEDMPEPTDDVLEQVSQAMVRLDEQFRMLEPVGLVEFQPVDPALLAEAEEEEEGEGEGEAAQGSGLAAGAARSGDGAGAASGAGAARTGEPDDGDVTRYGMVRLTPLGRFGLRTRLLDAGYEAPVVGDLADKGADTLLSGTAGYPQAAAQEEIDQWLARHEPLAGARELLAAARGGDDGGPLRRLRCQQALSLVGLDAEAALREVLDDAELGGLARVWLTEKGARQVPPPSEAMVFWLTIDTLAAQLAAEGNSDELQGLVEGLAAQHSGFFDTAWRVDHPATTRVLEAMGRLHPDKRIAKEARKAAFKARSHPRT
ncbi:hypothetical protein [Streptomyces sp. TS71-3]|uniref:hypothetical protein n=1 Tax=Streptomyces sp. TS71-3 TaxID=2733862 RepID=UPI001B2DF65E|nr:hypothetical protein [Streptomyces sp. TS71-3]GHJ38389.1 hypothetical protein Sm713_39980 [Streptomyces sp. TS71-3]